LLHASNNGKKLAELLDLHNSSVPHGEPISEDNPVLKFAIDPSGHWLATRNQDFSLHLWDLSSDQPTLQSTAITADDSGLDQLAFSPDGKNLLAGTQLFDMTQPPEAIAKS